MLSTATFFNPQHVDIGEEIADSPGQLGQVESVMLATDAKLPRGRNCPRSIIKHHPYIILLLCLDHVFPWVPTEHGR